MGLTPVTVIRRYVAIDKSTVVRSRRTRQQLDAYADPPAVEFVESTWGRCFTDSPDQLYEGGSLQSLLRGIASPARVAASAAAQPERFAEMVTEEADIGLLIAVGSSGRILLGESVPNGRQYCDIATTPESIQFYTLQQQRTDREFARNVGVRSVHFSLKSFSITSKKIIARCRK